MAATSSFHEQCAGFSCRSACPSRGPESLGVPLRPVGVPQGRSVPTSTCWTRWLLLRPARYGRLHIGRAPTQSVRPLDGRLAALGVVLSNFRRLTSKRWLRTMRVTWSSCGRAARIGSRLLCGHHRPPAPAAGARTYGFPPAGNRVCSRSSAAGTPEPQRWSRSSSAGRMGNTRSIQHLSMRTGVRAGGPLRLAALQRGFDPGQRVAVDSAGNATVIWNYTDAQARTSLVSSTLKAGRHAWSSRATVFADRAVIAAIRHRCAVGRRGLTLTVVP